MDEPELGLPEVERVGFAGGQGLEEPMVEGLAEAQQRDPGLPDQEPLDLVVAEVLDPLERRLRPDLGLGQSPVQVPPVGVPGVPLGVVGRRPADDGRHADVARRPGPLEGGPEVPDAPARQAVDRVPRRRPGRGVGGAIGGDDPPAVGRSDRQRSARGRFAQLDDGPVGRPGRVDEQPDPAAVGQLGRPGALVEEAQGEKLPGEPAGPIRLGPVAQVARL